jgi:hypothetical protein
MAIDYQRIMADSVQRLSELRGERSRLDHEIERLQRLVRTMANHSRGGTDPETITKADSEALGLTKAVSQVFQTYDLELTPVNVHALLPTIGFDTSKYKDPLTSIHAILRRLVSRNIITRKQGSSGSTVYVRTDATAGR